MDAWLRIGDDEHAAFGKRNMVFAGSIGTCLVKVDEQNQDNVLVSYRSIPLRWAILHKSAREGVFRLQGMSRGSGDPYGDGVYWFELTLSEPAVLRCYGDRALTHEDQEAQSGTGPPSQPLGCVRIPPRCRSAT